MPMPPISWTGSRESVSGIEICMIGNRFHHMQYPLSREVGVKAVGRDGPGRYPPLPGGLPIGTFAQGEAGMARRRPMVVRDRGLLTDHDSEARLDDPPPSGGQDPKRAGRERVGQDVE